MSLLSVSGRESEPEEATRKTSMLALSAEDTLASDESIGVGGGPSGFFTQSDPSTRKVVPDNVGERTLFKVTFGVSC